MVQNALLAVAAGRVFGLSLEDCAAGLIAAPLTKARLQIKEIRRRAIPRRQLQRKSRFDESGIATHWLNWTPTGQRIAVLGEMRELGDESERGHREVGETAAALKIDQLIAHRRCGRDAIAEGAKQAGLTK